MLKLQNEKEFKEVIHKSFLSLGEPTFFHYSYTGLHRSGWCVHCLTSLGKNNMQHFKKYFINEHMVIFNDANKTELIPVKTQFLLDAFLVTQMWGKNFRNLISTWKLLGKKNLSFLYHTTHQILPLSQEGFARIFIIIWASDQQRLGVTIKWHSYEFTCIHQTSHFMCIQKFPWAA